MKKLLNSSELFSSALLSLNPALRTALASCGEPGSLGVLLSSGFDGWTG